MRQAVIDYYALLPDNWEQAWQRLGPALQAQGRARYASFWADVKAVWLVTPPQVIGNNATVQIEYTTHSGGRIRETHQLGMIATANNVLINSNRLISSSQITPGGKGDKGGKNGGKGRGGGDH